MRDMKASESHLTMYTEWNRSSFSLVLKVLKGSYMEEMAGEYGLLYKSQPPYEVLSTRWLGYDDIIRLKGVEEMVEVHYNSGQFRNVLKELVKEFDTPL